MSAMAAKAEEKMGVQDTVNARSKKLSASCVAIEERQRTQKQ